jgi:hypothetical protein
MGQHVIVLRLRHGQQLIKVNLQERINCFICVMR